MKRLITISFLLLFTILIKYSKAQTIPVIKITDLEARINKSADTTLIVNFWATWCAPCVKELPDFDSIQTVYQKEKVKVILVTLDFVEELDKKVIPFVKNKGIKSEVVLLDESNGNYFIPKVSNEWTGAIPATLIVNTEKGQRYFYEKKLDYAFLESVIKDINLKK